MIEKRLVVAAAAAALMGCSHQAQSIGSTQLQQEKSAQRQLNGMSQSQIGEMFGKDPRRARAMLMPPGMGDPHFRLDPGQSTTTPRQSSNP